MSGHCTLFTPTGDHAQYAICSPIADEYGTVYFKNDSAHLMAFGSKIVSLNVTKKPDRMIYQEGEHFDPAGMTITATYANGKTRDVTGYVTIAADPITEGNTTVTISFNHVLYHNQEEGTGMVSGMASTTPVTTLEVKLAGVEGDVSGDRILTKEDTQFIVALSELGVPADEKVGLQLTFQTENGDFRHVTDGNADPLATEQVFCALVSAALAQEGKSLYRMAANACTLEIRCDTLLKNLDRLSPGKAELVPQDGVLLEKTTVTFEPGETVFDVLRRCLRQQNIHYEYVDAQAYGTTYIEGIGNLYEFDCGEQSGWLYFVNGISPGLGCSVYTVANGDEILFAYSCDFGADLFVEKIG